VETISASPRVSKRELRAAEDGFLRLLRCKRFSTVWIEENAADLFAQAQKEYAERLAAGEPADNPVGWLIVCAWQRTKNLLDSRRRKPQAAPIEAEVDLADTSTPTPEQQVIDRDRVERIRKAMGYLTEEERRLLELSYFEGMSVREAGRELGWGKSSADRHHQAALERLRAMLGGQRDLLGVEIGLAAWLGRARAHGVRPELPHGLGTLLVENAKSGAASVGNWIAEGWRRLSPLSDPGSAAVTSGAVRTAGACGAAAVACFASGVIGPGIGGVDMIAHSSPVAKPAKTRQAATVQPGTEATSASAAPAETSAAPQAGSAQRSGPSRPAHRSARTQTASEPTQTHREPQTAAEQTATEFGIEGGSSGSSASSPSTPTSGAAPRVSSSSSASSGSTSHSTSKGSGSSSGSEFGM
jgi:RNA polymerase sigma factor (sigma-70 family)